MTNSVHLTTEQGEHYWSVGDERGSVSLTADFFAGAGYDEAADAAPNAANYLSRTEDGWWVFDVLQSHRLATGDSDCFRHVGCNSDAFVFGVAEPLWLRVRAAGVTDEVVFAELKALHDSEFEIEEAS